MERVKTHRRKNTILILRGVSGECTVSTTSRDWSFCHVTRRRRLIKVAGIRSLSVKSSTLDRGIDNARCPTRDWSFNFDGKSTGDRYLGSSIVDSNFTRDRSAAARDITLPCSDRSLCNFARNGTLYGPSAVGSGAGLQRIIAFSVLNSSVHTTITASPEVRSISIHASTPREGIEKANEQHRSRRC